MINLQQKTPPNNGYSANKQFIEEQKKDYIFSQKYNLPNFDGSVKQCEFAVGMRVKFITEFEKETNLSEEITNDIYNRVFQIHNAGAFLNEFAQDGKKNPFKHYLLKYAEKSKQTHIISEKQPVKSNVFLISTYDTKKVTIRTSDASVDNFLKENEFTQTGDFYWEKLIDIDSVNRQQIINSMIFGLIDMGKTIRLEKDDPMPKPKYHDAVISKINGKLKVICNSQNTYNAFSRIGAREIDITNTDTNEIKTILKKFDVGFENEELKKYFI